MQCPRPFLFPRPRPPFSSPPCPHPLSVPLRALHRVPLQVPPGRQLARDSWPSLSLLPEASPRPGKLPPSRPPTRNSPHLSLPLPLPLPLPLALFLPLPLVPQGRLPVIRPSPPGSEPPMWILRPVLVPPWTTTRTHPRGSVCCRTSTAEGHPGPGLEGGQRTRMREGDLS